MTHLPFSTILFDVDGTLIDSNGAHAQAWSKALREFGVDAGVERIRPLIGMGGDKLLPAVARISEDSKCGKDIVRRKKAVFAELLPTLEPTRGARPLLAYLRERGVDVVIATSADKLETSALLRQAGIDGLVPKRASKDDARASKPDPDIVHAAMARARARPDRTVMIGDTPYDIEAAHRAGIDAIALRCGGYWDDGRLQGAREILDDPEGLLRHWRKNGRG